MKEITTRDLKESLTLLFCQKQEDGAGGWRELWKKGPLLWASLWPIMGGSGFQVQDPGGPMASHCGHVPVLPPPHYRLIIRAGLEIPTKSRFLWHLRQQSKHLSLVNRPVLIQYHRFLCMTVMEEKNG